MKAIPFEKPKIVPLKSKKTQWTIWGLWGKLPL